MYRSLPIKGLHTHSAMYANSIRDACEKQKFMSTSAEGQQSGPLNTREAILLTFHYCSTPFLGVPCAPC